jgi:uncharacterized surface protein with fasciclin (FAS1) repeats
MRKLHTLAAAAALLALPALAPAQHSSTETRTMKPTKTIAQLAADAGNLNTLVAALEAAGLVETLQGPGPFTVFAPTDAAFGRLPAGTLEALLADREKLTSILTYHVVKGRVTAADIIRAEGATPTAINGRPLDVVVRGGQVYVNGARVVTADVAASNGVVHVIDTVLLPEAAPVPATR